MKKAIIGFMTLILVTSFVFANNNLDVEKEKAAIKKVIEKSYVQGVFIKKDTEAMAKGFHAEFNMLTWHDGHMHKYPIARWIKSVKKNPKPPKEKFTHKVPLLDVTGIAAIAKVEIYRDSKHIYTDYLSFYNFGENWQIVSKIFQEHK